jgi:hypothetical protein
MEEASQLKNPAQAPQNGQYVEFSVCLLDFNRGTKFRVGLPATDP